MQSFQSQDALLIVDPQLDFFPSGALPVPEGDHIVPILNKWIGSAQHAHIPILISRDWHPRDHVSFKSQGGIWPEHCIQNTVGASFHPELAIPMDAIVINKAFESNKEAYSAFEGQLLTGASLESYLHTMKVKRLWIGGLALDYCVKATVLDAVAVGFQVKLILSATRAISKDTQEQCLGLLQEKGVQFID